MSERFTIHPVDPLRAESIAEVIQKYLKERNLGANSARDAPLNICIQTIAQLGARTIIRQRDVQDPDFIAEHSVYYSRWTTMVSRYCDRLHIFREPLATNDILDYIDKVADDDYLGFLTLRPIRMSPVGATILAPPQDPPRYILAYDTFKVNIAGRSFFVSGTPFLQQDNAVGACAQASIWMAFRTMRKKEGHAAFSPAQITSAATRFYVIGRTLPNRDGLAIEQIAEAIRSAGYSPHLLPLKSEVSLKKRSLYPYIESGIPVLLALVPRKNEGHAVVVIGHGWQSQPDCPTLIARVPTKHWQSDIAVYDAASWTEPFIIHNDNSGPYLNLAANEGAYNLNQAQYAIPLLKVDVFIDGAEALEASLRLLRDALSLDLAKGMSVSAEAAPQIVLRLYMQERADFRKAVNEGNASPEIKRYYRLKWLPKRFWIAELNTLENYGNTANGANVRVGEILLDAAAEAEEGAFLAIRFAEEILPDAAQGIGSVIIDRDALTGTIKAFPIAGNFTSPLKR